MSAIRGNDRRATRSTNSSPYASARQLPKKKSSWTFGIGGLLSYINPLRPRRFSDPDKDEDASDFEDMDGQDVSGSDDVPSSTDTIMRSQDDSSALENPQIAQNPAASLSTRGHQLINNINGTHQTLGQMLPYPGLMPSTPPRVMSNSPPDDTNLSPAESLEKVQKFLKEKNGQALSEWETRGLLTFLEKNVQNDNEKPEPFRFSSTPLRTPARGNSPVFVFGSQGASPGTDGEGTTPRKTLSKNPNGVYRWQGAGSARPRNRYQSPSFGTRSPPPTIKLSPKTDIKRRRVGEDMTDHSASQTVPFPAVSPQKPANVSTSTPAPSQTRPSIFPSANGVDAAPNGASSSKTNGTSAPRLRTSGLPTKPTAPSVPSPLRQTWGQSDSPPHTPASRPNSTPTKAANFMTELIKDVTPSKRPDVSNPYQTASPVKPPAKKPVVKKPRASLKSPAPPPAPVKTPEPSPQAIIEATLPKGSKRSRPPPDLLKSTHANITSAPGSAAVPTRRSPQTPTLDLPSINGSKSVVSAEQNSKSSPVIVEDIDDDDDDDDRVAKKQKMTPVNKSTITVEEMDDIDMPSTSQSLFTQSVEIIEPDDDAGGSMADHTGFPASSTATSPVKSSFILKSSAPKEPSKLRFSYKGDASPPLTTPSPSFDPPPTPKVAHAELPGIVPTISKEVVITDPQRVVIAMAVHDLPIYSFLQPGLGARAGIDYLEGAQAAAKAMPTLLLPTFDFSMRAAEANAGRSTSSTVSGGGAAAPVTKGFDWAAAGLKAPSAAGTWICSLCMLSNPATANKCTVCETLR